MKKLIYIFLFVLILCSFAYAGDNLSCGNKVCDVGETEKTCPDDCYDRCGNGMCEIELKEDEKSCPSDCTKIVCGDKVCDASENEKSCPEDCIIIKKCGDGICELGEDIISCPSDCTNSFCANDTTKCIDSVCGDGICELGEDEISCYKDCYVEPQKPSVKSGLKTVYTADTTDTLYSDGTHTLIIGTSNMKTCETCNSYLPFNEVVDVTSNDIEGRIKIKYWDKEINLVLYKSKNNKKENIKDLKDADKSSFKLETKLTKEKGYYYYLQNFTNDAKSNADKVGYEIEGNCNWEEYKLICGEIVIDYTDAVEKQNLTITKDKATDSKDFSFTGDTLTSIDPTINLDSNNVGIIADVLLSQSSPGDDQGATSTITVGIDNQYPNNFSALFKINLTLIPDSKIINAQLFTYASSTSGTVSSYIGAYHVYNFPAYNISNQEWTEGTRGSWGEAAVPPEVSWNTRPINSIQRSLIPESNITCTYSPYTLSCSPSINSYWWWNITQMISLDKNAGYKNTSLILEAHSDSTTSSDDISFYSKEFSGTASDPYVVVDYANYIEILTPTDNQMLSRSANFSLDLNISNAGGYNDTIWYTWNGGIKNYTMCTDCTSTNGTTLIFPRNENYNITVYANNSIGTIVSDSVYVNKATNVCYQETANASNIADTLNCGLNYSGTYTLPGNPSYNVIVDGQWNTGVGVGTFDLYINYKIPARVLNTSIWKFQDGNAVGGELENHSLTIPSKCWNYDSDTLHLRIYNPSEKRWLCQNGSGTSDTNWTILMVSSKSNIYEEGMDWNISFPNNIAPIITNITSNNSNLTSSLINLTFNITDDNDYLKNISLYINNTLNITSYQNQYINVSTNTTLNFTLNLNDGSWVWYVRAYDSDNNYTDSIPLTFMLDTIAPVTTATAGTYTFGTWTKNDVSISLPVTENGVGYNLLQYPKLCVDTSNTCTPTITFAGETITTEGTSYIRYYSADLFGNTESVKSQTIMIDKTSPYISFYNDTTISNNYSQSWIFANLSLINYNTYNITLWNSTDIFYSYTNSSYSCYQESVNTTNQSGIDGNCGLNYSGNYYSNTTINFTSGSYNNIIDEDWDTYESCIENNTCELYINASMPSNAIYSTWQLRTSRKTTGAFVEYYNLSIPSGCFINNNTQLKIRMMMNNLTSDMGIVDCNDDSGYYYSCYNSSSWQQIYYKYACQYVRVYGESLTWGILNNSYNNFTSLPEGTYYLNATATDLAGNVNQTETRTITLDTTSPYIKINSPINTTYTTNNITINFTSDITNMSIWYYNGTVNVTYTDLTTALFGEGSHTIIAYANDSVNNVNSTNITFNIDTTPPTFTFIPNNVTITYPQSFAVNYTAGETVNWSINSTTYFQINSTGWLMNKSTTPAGTYIINVTINDSVGNQNYSMFKVTVNKANNILSPLLNSVNANLSVTYPTQVNASGTSTFGIVAITRNGTSITNGANYTLAAGYYIFNYTIASSENYTNNDTLLYANVSKSNSNIVLTLNGSESNISINASESIWINATLTVGVGNISVYKNDTLISINLTSTANLTNFTQGGLFNITVYYSGNENYSANQSYTWYVNVTDPADIIPPYIKINSPINTTYTTNNITINFTSDITNMSIWYYNGTANVTYTDSTTALFGEGSHTIIAYANDTVNNVNSTNITFTIDSILPYVSFIENTLNSSIINKNSIYVNVTSNDTNYVSTFIDFDNSLVSWWRMDDLNSSGDLVDYTNNNNGSVNGATQIDGRVGKAFNFDGNDYIDLDKKIPISNVTISFWVKFDKCSGYWQSIIGAKDTTNSFEIDKNLNDCVFSAYSYGILKSTFNLTQSQWYHIVLINNISGNWLYINGSYNNQNTYGYNLPPINASIGKWRALQPLNGSVDDIMIFNRSLSADEIAALYSNTTSKYVGYNFTGLSDKNYTFKAYSQDINANVNLTETRNILIDTTKPYVRIIFPVKDASYNYHNQSLNFTVSDLRLDSCWKNLNGNLNVTIGCNENNTVNNGSEGTIEGLNTITFYANDTLGNINYTTISFFDSITLPIINLLSPSDSWINYTNNISFNFTSDVVGTVDTCEIWSNFTGDWKINKTILNVVDAVQNFTLINVSDGVYTWNVKCNDTVANSNWAINRTLKIDSITPYINYDIGTEANNTNTTNTFIFVNTTWTEINLQNIIFGLYNGESTVSLFSSSSAIYNYNFTSLSDDTYYYNVTITDVAGNKNITPTRTITIDTTLPYISFYNDTTTSGNYSQSWIFANLTTTDSHWVNSTIYLYNLTDLVLNITNVTSGNYSYNFTSLPDTTYRLNSSSYDIVNNYNQTETRTITLDTILPYINYDIGTEANNTNTTNTFIFVNTTWTELNFKNISFELYNTSGIYNSSPIISPTYNINFTNLIDNIYYYNVTITDVAGNKNSTTTRKILLDDTAPTISIQYPQAVNYGTNNSLSLNYTTIDNLIGIDRCWYYVKNSSGTEIVSTLLLSSCENTTFSLPDRDDTYTLYLFSRDELYNLNSKTVTFGIVMSAPAIALYPSNNTFVKTNLNTFNFTSTSRTPNISSCQLWTNFTGTWSLNQTLNTVSNSSMNSFTAINLAEGDYIWNVWCNDTFNHPAWGLNNNTFIVDTTLPYGIINTITTIAGSLDFTFNVNATDNNLDVCKYTIYNAAGDTTGGINNSFITNCTTTQSRTLASIGVYNLTVEIFDKASNENRTWKSFTLSATPVSPGGGGGGTVTTVINQTIITNITQSLIDLPFCGNSVCDVTHGESTATCPQDCKEPALGWFIKVLLWVIPSIIVLQSIRNEKGGSLFKKFKTPQWLKKKR